jgi:hypothetical protein
MTTASGEIKKKILSRLRDRKAQHPKEFTNQTLALAQATEI